MVKGFSLAFENCRNIAKIDSGALPLQFNRLNVLFGSNGTGKTTVAKVLDYWNDPKNPDKLGALKSFAYMQSQDEADAPNVPVSGARAKRVLIFNSEWVADHCFHDDGNLQTGAYRLYVSSPEVKKLEKERKALFAKLNAVLNDEETEEVRKLAEIAAKGIGTTMRGKTGSAFKDNAPLDGLPPALSKVVRSMKDQDKTKWMSWHVQGAAHAENIGRACPYCGYAVPNIQECIDFDSMHAAQQGDAWASAVSVFAEGKLFRITVSRKALKLMSGTKQLSGNDRQWIFSQAQRAKRLSDCIANARMTLNTFGNDSSDQFFEDMQNHFDTLKSVAGFTDPVRSVMKKLATAIRELLAKENRIRTLVDFLEGHAADNAAKFKVEIDFMLEKCGYPYTIEICSNCSNRESRVILLPRATGKPFDGRPRGVLSYGEQNTLALILFMFEAIGEKDSCIVVLDDPISSFDGDKRFALLYRMFHKFNKGGSMEVPRDSLAGRTVVLLTHDYLVVSDILTILGNKMIKPWVLHLICGRGGILSYRVVGADSVQPYIQMVRKRVKKSASKDIFFQLVYLRCYCEMMRRAKGDRRTSEGCAFVVISLLVDGYSWEDVLNKLAWEGGPDKPYILRTGEGFIRRYIPGFAFESAFSKLRDDAEICRLYGTEGITPYEKLQVLRLLIRQKKICDQNPIMIRYANEVYHLAGDYLLQLDPVDFNPVPPFVVDWSDSMFNDFAAILQGDE